MILNIIFVNFANMQSISKCDFSNYRESGPHITINGPHININSINLNDILHRETLPWVLSSLKALPTDPLFPHHLSLSFYLSFFNIINDNIMIKWYST